MVIATKKNRARAPHEERYTFFPKPVDLVTGKPLERQDISSYLAICEETLTEAKQSKQVDAQRVCRAHINRGVGLLESKSFDVGLREFETALTLDKMNTVALIGVGVCKLRTSDLDGALADFTKVLSIDPKNFDAFSNRGNVWSEKGEPEKAIADYDRALVINPGSALLYTNRGQVWGSLGDYDKAIENYTKAITLDPVNFRAFYNRGHVWYLKSDYDQAIEDYTRAIEIDASAGFAYHNRGACWSAKKEYDKAIADFNKSIEVTPLQSMPYHGRGNVWTALGEFDKALADYNQAVKLEPYYAKLYYSRGLLWRRQKENDNAYADFSESIRLNKDNNFAYIERGMLLRETGEYKAAISDFDKAVETGGTNLVLAHYLRAQCRELLGDIPLAVADFSKAIELEPGHGDALCSRGSLFRMNGDYDEAIQDFTEAIKTRESCVGFAYLQRGFSWRAKLDYDRAIADLSKAIEMEYNLPIAYEHRGLTWLARKDYAKAIQDLDKAIELSPHDSSPLLNLSVLLSCCPEARHRNGEAALAGALKLCEMRPEHWTSKTTLAGALAELNRFPEAIAAQTDALVLYEGDDAEKLQELVNDLKLYKKNKPFRMSNPVKEVPATHFDLVANKSYSLGVGDEEQLSTTQPHRSDLGDLSQPDKIINLIKHGDFESDTLKQIRDEAATRLRQTEQTEQEPTAELEFEVVSVFQTTDIDPSVLQFPTASSQRAHSAATGAPSTQQEGDHLGTDVDRLEERVEREGDEQDEPPGTKKAAKKKRIQSDSPTAIECGKNIVRERKAKSLKAAQLAKLLGMKRNQLCRYEEGRELPSEDIMVQIAKKLGVAIEKIAPKNFQQAVEHKEDAGSELSEKQRKAVLYGEKLTAIHEKSRMSVQEVTEKIGKNRTQLYKYLGGKNLPNLEIRIQLAYAYGEPSLQEEPTLPSEASGDR